MSAPESSADREIDAVDTENDAVDADLQAADEDATVEVDALEDEDAAVEISPDEVVATEDSAEEPAVEDSAEDVAAEDVAVEETAAVDDAAPVEEAPLDEETLDKPIEADTHGELADAADLEGLHVSSRVRVTLEDGTTREGEIVDDFADLAPGDQTVEARIDEDHIARLRRWAISTDDHDIVFADDDAVELLSVS
ncbi:MULTISPECIES: hypothetical protein [Gordonia]|uniref:hypothetical protein n=1 Tax=Gordonia TaxID=2053 RepID=UPI0004B45AAC|nr:MULTISPECIES: hypothetical protein [Gordonia]AZZ83832.1 hypothetical protein C5O27_18125 [Gordonia alkanivorans]MDH3009024.1 hypothetical protein [Gordonia alkanivorans]MDH3013431.1 hypothetical protein [Gordonia alkanivorans]MDH3017935.1 hypothetical protein [Gordonia alkanivorans]MDH3022294.1 hypothetical protein [Gordonia alkanivorans]